MHLKRLNDFEIKPIGKRPRKKDYDELFHDPWVNIFCLAPKNSGKTNVIYRILEHDHKHGNWTTFAFCSTRALDATWKKMIKKFHIISASSIIDKESGDNLLEATMSEIKEILKNADDDQELNFHIIGDDLNKLLRDPSWASLFKKNRHLHCRVIISTQRLVDLNLDARSNLDYALLFPRLPTEDVLGLKSEIGSQLKNADFIDMYKKVTKTPHQFLYCDVKGNTFRRNFTDQIRFDDSDNED
jgi:hypothetical protein